MALKPDRTREELGLTIREKIIPWGARWTKGAQAGEPYKADKKLSSGTGSVAGVTIHNTGGDADAETYTRATWPNQNMKDARVHYYVDDKEAWQNLREDEVGWHAGDGSGPGNGTTLAIEIIMRGKAIKDDAKAEDNGARLAAALLHRHGLTIDKLYTHKDWSGKNCPLYILPHWSAFKVKVAGYLAELKDGAAGDGARQPYGTYTVVKGDTLTKIAARHKTTVDAILRANSGIKNPNVIRVGQKIFLPDGTPAPATQYLVNTAYKGLSLVTALKQIGVDASYAYRQKLAKKNGIALYIGTAAQNTKLLALLRAGKLKKV